MATIRAYVYRDPGVFDSYKVYPPIVIVSAGDTFELVNTVDEKYAKYAEWTIPDQLENEKGYKDKEQIPPKGRSKNKLKKDAVVAAVEYKVKVDGHEAKGNSDPVIIIDP
jgi:hypothetical protein